jgi:flagellar assembly factor FliW
MVVETTRFGELEVDPCRVITLPKGLIGFPPKQRFILIDHPHGGPFQWLQSLDDPALAFVVVDPLVYFPGYSVEIPDDEVALLRVRTADDAQILTTLTIRPDAGLVTANLLGPIVVGVESRLGAQLVLDGERFCTRHALPCVQRTQQNRQLQPA